MRILLYEFVTGGGWFAIDAVEPPPDSLLAEGAAMRSAVAEDLAAIGDCEVEVLQDERFPLQMTSNRIRVRNVWSRGEAHFAFADAVDRNDAVVLIAPEFDAHLRSLAEQVERSGKRLLSPSSEFVDVAGNKLKACDALLAADVNMPQSWQGYRDAPPPLAYPFLSKPIDGCGSHNVLLIRSDDDFEWRDETMLVQEFCPGQAASVAMLCGPSGLHALAACTQDLTSDNGRFEYLGGSCPLPPPLNQRAQALARRAVAALPPAIGYVGVDLVLGDAEDSSQDYVIEINPRLTTSYVGLRALSETNLAQAMLDVAMGREPQLKWRSGRVRFSADGTTNRLSHRDAEETGKWRMKNGE